MIKKRKYFSLAIPILLILTVFQLGFTINFWNAAEEKWFKEFQMDSESLILGRLAQSRLEGVFSESMFLGWGQKENSSDIVLEQAEYYYGNSEHRNFQSYRSQIGFQGLIYGLIDKYTYISNEETINLLRFLNSLALSILITAFIFWVRNEFGWITAIFTTITTLYSQWLNVIAKNLYWVTWTMFLPFIIMLFLLNYEDRFKKHFNLVVQLLMFMAILLKSINGYEYISTIMISMVVPIIYYGIKNKWKIRDFLIRVIHAGSAGMLGFFTAILLHTWQLSLSLGSFQEGFGLLKYTVLKRTHGSAEKVEPVLRASLEADFSTVISPYLNGKIFTFTNVFGSYTFKEIILVFFIFSVLTLISTKYSPSIESNRMKLFSLVVALWLSFLSPLSWFILAKGHSYIHTHINHFLWHLSFTLLGFTLIGFVTQLLLIDFLKKYNIKKNGFI